MVKVLITATVEVEVELEESETPEEYLNRDVDIYLHGAKGTPHAATNKQDLGSDANSKIFRN